MTKYSSSIDKMWNIRTRHRKPLPEGHHVPFHSPSRARETQWDMRSTPGVQEDKDAVVILPEGDSKAQRSYLSYSKTQHIGIDAPDHLELYIKLCPQSVLPHKATLQLEAPYKGQWHDPVLVYDSQTWEPSERNFFEKACHRKIVFVYQNAGSFYKQGISYPFQGSHIQEWYFDCFDHRDLYTVAYETVPEKTLIQSQICHGDHDFWYDPPGQENCIVLYPFGGYYNEDLETAHQLYFQPCLTDQKPMITLWDMNSLRHHNITPPFPGQHKEGASIVFQNISNNPVQDSLSAQIFAGHILLTCTHATQKDVKLFYRSRSYQWVDRSQDLITLRFDKDI